MKKNKYSKNKRKKNSGKIHCKFFPAAFVLTVFY